VGKKKDEPQPAQPVVRVAPLGELNVYTIYEHELVTLGQGSPGSVFLSFALALLPLFSGCVRRNWRHRQRTKTAP
jgi:hypothetical protein